VKEQRLGEVRGIVETVNAACTCGGAGPGEGCPACEVYHGIKDMLVIVPPARPTQAEPKET
jgi:hypothetical protein